jgi:hypothetical protein
VHLLSRLLYQIDPEAAVAGMRDGGAVVAQQLSAEKTVAIQISSGISSAARINVGRLLGGFLGSTFFAHIGKCDTVVSKHISTQVFSTYEYKVIDPDTKEECDKSVEYYVIDPYQAMINQLKSFRVSFPYESMNIDLGVLGEAIGVCFQSDHGGGSMKCIELVLARRKNKQTIKLDLARFEGKECHEVMMNTVMPSMDSGFARMSETVLVFVEWGDGFDFVDIPKGKTVQYQRIEDNVMRVMWDDGYKDFEKSSPSGA